MQVNKKYFGFTLLELIITIGILFTILGITLILIRPGLVLNKAEDNIRSQDVEAVATAVRFAQIKNGRFPFNFPSKTEGWAVGSNQTFIYYDGTNWVDFPDHPNHPIQQPCLDVPIPDNCEDKSVLEICTLAAPENCVPPFISMNDLELTSPIDVWAVSNVAGIWHYDGSGEDGWTVLWGGKEGAIGMNSSIVLSAIVMLSPNKGWVGGDLYTLVEWNGDIWTEVFDEEILKTQIMAPPFNYSLDEYHELCEWVPPDADNTVDHWHCGGFRDIQMLSASDGWAVADGGVIAHYDGVSWKLDIATKDFTPDINFLHLSMLSPTEGWASANFLFHFLNNTWTQLPMPSPGGAGIGKVLKAFSQNDVWFCVNVSGTPMIYQYDGIVWNDKTLDYDTNKSCPRAFAREGADILWTINAEGEVWKFESNSWGGGSPYSVPAPGESLNGLYVISTNDSWISMLVDDDMEILKTAGGCAKNNDNCLVPVSDPTFCVDGGTLVTDGILQAVPVSPPGNVVWDKGVNATDNGTGYTIQKKGSTIVVRACEAENTDEIEVYN